MEAAEPAGELERPETADLTDAAAPPRAVRADLADPGQRLLARIIDTLVVGLPVVMVLLETVPRSRLDVLAPPIVAGLLLLYEVPQTALWGRTLGKRAAGVAVVAQDTDAPPGFPAALVRAATYALPIAVRPVPFLGLVASLFWVANGAAIYEGARRALPDGPRRALHDRFARTDVVKTDPEPGPDAE
ncbi:RDD family protein [Actinomadura atramentaria]|uniref:RDD family protein n=1 Tax=Actinomadura atramentaria TaxID=1990 RepID=UPI0003691B4B|nr:RDD family protein [Actinomadura atramentaria]